jgi:type I restriction enzyme R subunit
MAIAEWPVPGDAGSPLQTADYVLFDGLAAVGIVEAHRLREDVRAFLFQARRCSRNFDSTEDLRACAGSPWGRYRVPFLSSTDGRSETPGIWFCDGRLQELPERLIHAFDSPQELRRRLS